MYVLQYFWELVLIATQSSVICYIFKACFEKKLNKHNPRYCVPNFRPVVGKPRFEASVLTKFSSRQCFKGYTFRGEWKLVKIDFASWKGGYVQKSKLIYKTSLPCKKYCRHSMIPCIYGQQLCNFSEDIKQKHNWPQSRAITPWKSKDIVPFTISTWF